MKSSNVENARIDEIEIEITRSRIDQGEGVARQPLDNQMLEFQEAPKREAGSGQWAGALGVRQRQGRLVESNGIAG